MAITLQGLNTFGNNRLVAGLGTGLLSGIGSFIGNSISKDNAKELAEYQYYLARAYAKYTGTHAHQWEVQDLRDAGLNPILSANSGTTYSGSSGFNPSGSPDFGNPVKDAIDTALSVRSTEANLENMSANTQKQKSESDLINQQTKMNVLQQDYQRTLNAISDLEKQLKAHNLPYEKRMTIQREINLQREGLETISRIKNNYQNIELMKSQQSLNSADKVLKKAQTWRQYHQALGFSKTESSSESRGKNLGVHIHGVSTGNDYSRSYSNTISY